MRIGTWIFASLTLNAVLAVLCFQPGQRSVNMAADTMPISSNAPRRTVSTVVEVAAPTEVVKLDWSQIESPDYPQYIQNLRNAKCPEETIRDIVIADVQKLYAQKWRAARHAQPVKTEWAYWKGNASFDHELKYFNPTQRADELLRRKLKREMEALIQDLLGIDLEDDANKQKLADQNNSPEARLAFLSPEKAAQVRALQRKWQRKLADFRDDVELGDGSSPATRRQEVAMKQQRDAEIAQVLDPAEMQEYNLRFSDSANTLRRKFSGFNFTEDEFRKLFAIQQSFDLQRAALDPDPENKTAEKQRADLDKQALTQLRAALDPDRQAEFDRSQNGWYQEAVGFTKTYDLPRDVAGQLLEIQKAADQAVTKVRGDQSLPPEQRKDILTRMRAETEKTLTDLLGVDNFQHYRSSSGNWLRYSYR